MARRQTKDQIANEMYGYDFDDLEGGEKAAVTRKYNAQKVAPKKATRRAKKTTASPSAVVVKIGRIGTNGMKECALSAGSTVADLIEQSGFELSAKEKLSDSNGDVVSDSDELVNGETYLVAPEIDSAY